MFVYIGMRFHHFTMFCVCLYDTMPLFVYTDQLLCHFIFICSNVHRQLIYHAMAFGVASV